MSHHARPMSENVRGKFHKKIVENNGIYSMVPSPNPGPDGRHLWVMAEGQPDRPRYGPEMDALIREGHHEPEGRTWRVDDQRGYDPYKHNGFRDHLLQPLTLEEHYRSGAVQPYPPGADAHPYDWQARAIFADWLDENHPGAEYRYGSSAGEHQRSIAKHVANHPDLFPLPEGYWDQRYGEQATSPAPPADVNTPMGKSAHNFAQGGQPTMYGRSGPQLPIYPLVSDGLSYDCGQDHAFHGRTPTTPWVTPEEAEWHDWSSPHRYAFDQQWAESLPPYMEDEYTKAGYAMNYGEPEEDELLRAIDRAGVTNPAGHGIVADWYDEHDKPQEGDFRRQLMSWLHERHAQSGLIGPFQTDRDSLSGLPQGDRVGKDRYQQRTWNTNTSPWGIPDSSGELHGHSFEPFWFPHHEVPTWDHVGSKQLGPRDWGSLPSFLEPGLMASRWNPNYGQGELEDANFWLRREQYPHHLGHGGREVHPAERLVAGIDSVADFDPEHPANAGLWGQVEQMLRHRHDMGQRLEGDEDPVEYADHGYPEEQQPRYSICPGSSGHWQGNVIRPERGVFPVGPNEMKRNFLVGSRNAAITGTPGTSEHYSQSGEPYRPRYQPSRGQFVDSGAIGASSDPLGYAFANPNDVKSFTTQGQTTGIYEPYNPPDMILADLLSDAGDPREHIVRRDLSFRGAHTEEFAHNLDAFRNGINPNSRPLWHSEEMTLELPDGHTVEVSPWGEGGTVDGYNLSWITPSDPSRGVGSSMYVGHFNADEGRAILDALRDHIGDSQVGPPMPDAADAEPTGYAHQPKYYIPGSRPILPRPTFTPGQSHLTPPGRNRAPDELQQRWLAERAQRRARSGPPGMARMSRATMYGADDIRQMLELLQASEYEPHRWGDDHPLVGLRGVLADAMDDERRTDEAELLRAEGQPIEVMPTGRVGPILPGEMSFEGGANAYFHEHPRNGRAVVMGDINGPWGADVYPNMRLLEAGYNHDLIDPWNGDGPHDFETKEELLAALKAAGHIHPQVQFPFPAPMRDGYEGEYNFEREGREEDDGIVGDYARYARLDYAPQLPQWVAGHDYPVPGTPLRPEGFLERRTEVERGGPFGLIERKRIHGSRPADNWWERTRRLLEDWVADEPRDTFRAGVLADYVQDAGRHDEAAVIRQVFLDDRQLPPVESDFAPAVFVPPGGFPEETPHEMPFIDDGERQALLEDWHERMGGLPGAYAEQDEPTDYRAQESEFDTYERLLRLQELIGHLPQQQDRSDYSDDDDRPSYAHGPNTRTFAYRPQSWSMHGGYHGRLRGQPHFDQSASDDDPGDEEHHPAPKKPPDPERLSRYGLEDDIAHLHGQINQEPMDITRHLILADMLKDRDADRGDLQPDEAFRRSVADSLGRRLGFTYPDPVTGHSGWQEPQLDRNQFLSQMSWGPEDDYFHDVTIRPRTETFDFAHMRPALSGPSNTNWTTPHPHYEPDGSFVWDVESLQEGLHRDDPRIAGLPTLGAWRDERRHGRAPGLAGVRRRGAHVLAPAERLFAGIDNLANVDPQHWPALEELMRDRFDMGQRMEGDDTPTEYGDREDLEAAARQFPFEFTPRGALADWHQEQGDEREADFQRKYGEWMASRADLAHSQVPYPTVVDRHDGTPDWARGRLPIYQHDGTDGYVQARWVGEDYLMWVNEQHMEEALRRAHGQHGPYPDDPEAFFEGTDAPLAYADINHDALAARLLNGRPFLHQVTPTGQAYKISDGATLQAFLDAGGKLPEDLYSDDGPHMADPYEPGATNQTDDEWLAEHRALNNPTPPDDVNVAVWDGQDTPDASGNVPHSEDGPNGFKAWSAHNLDADFNRSYFEPERDQARRERRKPYSRVTHYSDDPHAPWLEQINAGDRTAGKVYADFLEEVAPEAIHDPSMLDVLRHHPGNVWASRHPTTGAMLAGPKHTWDDLRALNGDRYGWHQIAGGIGRGEHFGFFPAFTEGENTEIVPSGNPYSGPGGTHFVTTENGELQLSPYHSIWRLDPDTNGVEHMRHSTDPEWAHRHAAELAATHPQVNV